MSFCFWPKLENSEPDILIKVITESGTEILICLEAKYWSDKSSHEDQLTDFQERTNGQRDQLAREIEDIHKNSCHRYFNIDKNKVDNIVLIYSTNHTSFPRKEILESILHVKGVHFQKEQLYWTTWREIHNSIGKTKSFFTTQDSKLLKDLNKLLEKKGLQSFNGFLHNVEKVPGIINSYHTTLALHSWTCQRDTKKLNWYYGGNQSGDK